MCVFCTAVWAIPSLKIVHCVVVRHECKNLNTFALLRVKLSPTYETLTVRMFFNKALASSFCTLLCIYKAGMMLIIAFTITKTVFSVTYQCVVFETRI
jgi:hypothetical protein